jgi:hypothetical protein
MAAPNEISCKNLLRLIGMPDRPVIIDISIDPYFSEDPFLFPGSFRHPHTDFEGLVARLNGRGCNIACQQGIKLSQGLTSRLRGRGIVAQYLEVGMYGWRHPSEEPRIPFAALPAPNLWVTRHRPKIDRIAWPWLIRCFINADAEFMFVSPDRVTGVADRYSATPFDIPDVVLTHKGGHCTFDAMLDLFDLRTDALNRLSEVIRSADTDSNNSPQAAGLLAVSVGLSRMYRDDHAQLHAAMPLFEALYRWARDGAQETHASLTDAP